MLPSARADAEKENQPLKLVHADRLLSSGGNGEIVNLVGNVHFSHGEVDLYSDRATWYRKSGLVQFTDSVVVIDNRRTIRASSMTYYRKDRRVSARGGVTMEDKGEDLLLICDRAEYYRVNRQFDAFGNPVLILHPHNDSTKMEIKARRMEYFADRKEGMAYDSVTIAQKQMTAESGLAHFFQEPEEAILTEKPVVNYEGNRLVGDSISIFTRDRTIDRLLARGNAGAYYRTQPDTTIDSYTTADLTGKELEAFFSNEKIQKAVMRFNAVSVYTPAVTDTLTRGVNTASGDSITLYFDKGYIRRVYISGGARGEYIEPKIVPGEEKPKYDTTRYSGNEIDYSFEDSGIKLYDNGELRYQDMILKAGDIRYKIDTRILTAEGIVADSSGKEGQLPVLMEGTEKLDGHRMSYNLETKKGQVLMARTEFENGFYDGQRIRQVSEDVLFVSSGDYTSCNKIADPHYHFHSDRMKMVGKDKIIAKPVILYIGELPVFAVPYYVFPIRKGRHSGFLTFEIGNFERGQRFIRNLGYYWAASDYWDLETSVDFYENIRTIFNTAINYGLRYRLNGNIGLNYSRDSGWVNYRKSLRNRWRVNFNHSHQISQSSKIAASGSFISDKNFVSDNVYNQYDRLDRTVKSSGNFTKQWQSSSLVIAADQTWNLDTDVKSERLPSVSFTLPSFQVIPDPTKTKKKERIRPWEETREARKRFYHSLYLNLSTSAVNSRQRLNIGDSLFYWKKFQTVNTTSSIQSPQKLLGVLTVNPGINMAQTIYHIEWNRQVDSLGLRTDRAFTRNTYNLSVSSNTTIYGTVYPKFLGISGLRHVATPTVSYRFTPEIDKNEKYRSYTGVGTASRRSKSLSYSLDNLFQAKYVSGDEERKIDVFTMRFDGSYDFVKEERKLSDINASLRTAAIPHLSLDYRSTYSYYNFDNSRRPITNPMLVNSTIQTTITGGLGAGKREKDSSARPAGEGKLPVENPPGDKSAERETVGLGGTFTISHRYSVSRNSTGTTKTQWLDFSTELQPTPNWSISYRAHYDLKARQISSQQLDIGRDMHCWEGRFTWIPSGSLAGYYIRINIKSLPDIKLEKSEGGVRGA